jgi:predicted  nucleic acid-binding Zn-ribbon protein
MLPDQELAVRLQQIDLRTADLNKEIAALPKHLAEILKKLSGHEKRLDIDRAALVANQRDRKKLEGDNQTNEQKISKLRDQMLSAKNNEQYRAFQKEIEFCEAEIRKSEDRILDLMGDSETLDKNVKAAEISLKEQRARLEAEQAEAKKRTAADQAELAKLVEERRQTASGMTPEGLYGYERIRKMRGNAIAELAAGRCSACHVSQRPHFIQELKRGEKLMYCESCGRMLFYNPPQSYEQFAGVEKNSST